MNWLKESNRLKHFIYGIPCGFLGTVLFVTGIAVGMEFKDQQWGGKWDWLDLLSTILGGVIGQLLQIILITILI